MFHIRYIPYSVCSITCVFHILYVPYPLCSISAMFHIRCKARPDSTQAATPDTHTNRGHKTAYHYRQMTKRAAEAW
jgi:hypothetical protein